MNERQLIADLLSALEYHAEQTRPIEFSKVAIEAAREHLRKPAREWVGLSDEEWQELADKYDLVLWRLLKPEIEAKLREKNA